MKFVSSDTNVWLDFEAIGRLAWPFRLPYTYIMYEETLAKELLKPSDFSERLIRLGLKVIKLTEDELYFADDVLRKYKRLSKYDRVALAIAKKKKYSVAIRR